MLEERVRVVCERRAVTVRRDLGASAAFSGEAVESHGLWVGAGKGLGGESGAVRGSHGAGGGRWDRGRPGEGVMGVGGGMGGPQGPIGASSAGQHGVVGL